MTTAAAREGLDGGRSHRFTEGYCAPPTPRQNPHGDPYGVAALADECTRVERAERGRQPTLHVAAFRMGQIIAAGRLNAEHAHAALVRAGTALDLPASDVERTIRRGLERGAANPRTGLRHPNADPGHRDMADRVVAALDMWAAAAAEPWPGTTGSAQLRLLAAWMLKYVTVGKHHLSLSHRQWAEIAGVSKATVGRHAPDLYPWLIRERRGNGWTGAATVYRLGSAPTQARDPRRATGQVPPDPATVSETAHALDLPDLGTLAAVADPADHGPRSHNRWRILAHLAATDGTLSVPEMVTGTGLHPATIREHLRALEHEGRAEVVETVGRTNRWAATRTATPLAEEQAATARRERADRHAQERIVWRRRREVLRRNREAARAARRGGPPRRRIPQRRSSPGGGASHPAPASPGTSPPLRLRRGPRLDSGHGVLVKAERAGHLVTVNQPKESHR